MRYFLFFLFFIISAGLGGQLDLQHTLFMLNKMYYNPAYAGADAPFTLNVVARRQWWGFEGAPQFEALATDFPLLHDRVGLGFRLQHQVVGIHTRYFLAGNYVYRFQIGDGYLGAGLKTVLRYSASDYRDDRLHGSVDISMDGGIPMEMETSFAPDFGAGLYYQQEKFYAGLSVTHLLSRRLVAQGYSGYTEINGVHFYVMSGLRMKRVDDFVFEPQLLVRYVKGVPFDGDFNLVTTYRENLKLGLGYRAGGGLHTNTGESLSVFFGTALSETLFFGLSYDYTLTPLRRFSAGSFEVVLQYRIHKVSGTTTTINPRFF